MKLIIIIILLFYINNINSVNNRPSLPKTLNKLSYIDSNGQLKVHIIDHYNLPKTQTASIEFSIKTNSIIRLQAEIEGASTLSVMLLESSGAKHAVECRNTDRICQLFSYLPYNNKNNIDGHFSLIFEYGNNALGLSMELVIVSVQEYEYQKQFQKCDELLNKNNTPPLIDNINMIHTPRLLHRHTTVETKEEINQLNKENHFYQSYPYDYGYHIKSTDESKEAHSIAVRSDNRVSEVVTNAQVTASHTLPKVVANYRMNFAINENTPINKEKVTSSSNDIDSAIKLQKERGYWRISTKVAYNFLVSGSFQLLLHADGPLMNDNGGTLSNLLIESNFAGTTSTKSINEGINQILLRATVAPGNYTLSLIHIADDSLTAMTDGLHKNFELCKCARYGIDIHIDYVEAKPENIRRKTSCDADSLPLSLNLPGLMYNNRLKFLEKWRFDADSLSQDMSLKIEQPSLIRIVISHPKLQANITLHNQYKKDEALSFHLHHSTNNKNKNDENNLELSLDHGIFAYVMPGSYTLVISIEDVVLNVNNFCTLVTMAAEIAPYIPGQIEYEHRKLMCNENDAILPQTIVADANIEEFQTKVYRFPWKYESGKVLAEKILKLSSSSIVHVEIAQEFLYGDINIILTKQDEDIKKKHGKVKPFQWITRFSDERQSTERKVMKILVKAGTYKLKFVTGTTQINHLEHLKHVNSDFDKEHVNGCGFFRMHIRITSKAELDVEWGKSSLTCPYQPLPISLGRTLTHRFAKEHDIKLSKDLKPNIIHHTLQVAVPTLLPYYGKHQGKHSSIIELSYDAILRIQAFHAEINDKMLITLLEINNKNLNQTTNDDEIEEEDDNEIATSDVIVRSRRSAQALGSIVASLKANHKYRLEVVYVVPNTNVRRINLDCLHYTMEYSIIPGKIELPKSLMDPRINFFDPILGQSANCTNKTDTMPFPLPARHDFAKTYVYLDTPVKNCDILRTISFVSVFRLTEFRATLRYSFENIGLGIRLIRVGLSHTFHSYRSKVVAYGQPLFNKQEIKSVMLSPGAYHLEIFETHTDVSRKLKLKSGDQNLKFDVEASWYQKALGHTSGPYSNCYGTIERCPYKMINKNEYNEYIPDTGETHQAVTRMLPVEKLGGTYQMRISVSKPSMLRITLQQHKYPLVYKDISIKGPKDHSVSIDSKAIEKRGNREDTLGVTARLFNGGEYIIRVSWTGLPVVGLWLMRVHQYGECEKLIILNAEWEFLGPKFERLGKQLIELNEKNIKNLSTPNSFGISYGIPLSIVVPIPRYSQFKQTITLSVPDSGGIFNLDIDLSTIDLTLNVILDGPIKSFGSTKRVALIHQNRIFLNNITLSKGNYELHITDPFNYTKELGKYNSMNVWSSKTEKGTHIGINVDINVSLLPLRESRQLPITPDMIKRKNMRDHPIKIFLENREKDLEIALQNKTTPNDVQSAYCQARGTALPLMLDSKTHNPNKDLEVDDGRIFFSGDKFIVLNGKDGDTIQFRVKKPSLMRVFIQNQSPGFKMDAILLRHRKPLSEVNRGDILAESDDSVISSTMRERTFHAYISPQDDPFALIISQTQQSAEELLETRRETLSKSVQDATSPFIDMQALELGCGVFSMLLMIEPINKLKDLTKCSNGSDTHPLNEINVDKNGKNTFGMYSFSSKYINSHLLGNNSHENPNLFRYRITLNIKDPLNEKSNADLKAKDSNVAHLNERRLDYISSSRGPSRLTFIQAILGYNFVLSDFRLLIRDQFENVLVKGYGSPAKNHDGDLTFGHAIEASLMPGIHYIDIEEDLTHNPSLQRLLQNDHHNPFMMKRLNMTIPPLCFQFMLGIEVDAVGSHHRPRITGVLPMDGINLDPKWDLQLIISFSVPATMSTVSASGQDLSASGAVWLTPHHNRPGSPKTILPKSMRFANEDSTQLIVIFDHKNFQNFETYILKISPSQFHTRDGEMFTLFSRNRHVYHFGLHNYENHPLYNQTKQNNEQIGLGVEVSEHINCHDGYHLIGSTCIKNKKCEKNSCNGNGLCNDISGFPVCECFPGFITINDDYCSTCEDRRHKYPNCTLEEKTRDEYQMHEHCMSSILPYTLNIPGLLSTEYYGKDKCNDKDGPNSGLHIEDWYHINTNVGMHITNFNIYCASIFRVFVASDENVRTGLYQIGTNSSQELLLAGTLYKSKEGGMFKTLLPGSYNLVFIYDSPQETKARQYLSPCPQLHLELSITSLKSINNLPQSKFKKCPDKNDAPIIIKKEKTSAASSSYKIPYEGLKFNEPKTYVWINEKYDNIDTKSHANLQGPDIFTFEFTTEEFIGYQPYIKAELEHLFNIGQLRMELSHHLKGKTSKRSTGNQIIDDNNNALLSWTATKYADIHENMNRIRMPLPPGDYTLTISQPVLANYTLTPCLLYNFRLDIGYIRLPKSYQRKRIRQFQAITNYDPTDTESLIGIDGQYGGEFDNMEDMNATSGLPDLVDMNTRKSSVTKVTHLSRSAPISMAQEFLNVECELRPLPISLDTPGLLGDHGVRLHIQDRFRYDPMGREHIIPFTIKKIKSPIVHGHEQAQLETLFRLHIPFHSSKLGVDIKLRYIGGLIVNDKKTKEQKPRIIAGLTSESVDEHLTIILTPGRYELHFIFNLQFQHFSYHLDEDRSTLTERLACQGFDMELYIGPQIKYDFNDWIKTHSFLPKLLPNQNYNNFLPKIPKQPKLPYVYMNPPIDHDNRIHPRDADPRRYRTKPFFYVRHYTKEKVKIKDLGEVLSWKSHDDGVGNLIVVSQLPFDVVDNLVSVEFELEFSYIRSYMFLELQKLKDPKDTHHMPIQLGEQKDINFNTIYRTLTKGSYILKIVLKSSSDDIDLTVHNEDFKDIQVFYEFDLRIRMIKKRDEVHSCLLKGYELLPHSLNTPRFLGTHTLTSNNVLNGGSMHTFARYLVPNVHLHERSPLSLRSSLMNQTNDHINRGIIHPDEPDRMHFRLYSLSLFRIRLISSNNPIRTILWSFPCASRSVHRWHLYDGLNQHCRPRKLFDSHEHIVDFHKFLSAGLYELQIELLINHNTLKPMPCEHYELETAIEPLPAFHSIYPAIVCPHIHGHGADHFPPSPPSLITLPYYYHSFDHDRYERLYLQQRTGRAPVKRYLFTVPSPFRIYSEVNYEFINGQLDLQLKSVSLNTSYIQYGKTTRNRNTLAMDYMPAGRYILMLSVPRNGQVGWFCSFFSFTLDIQPIHIQPGASFGFGPTGVGVSVYHDPLSLLSPVQRIITPYPHLPTTLDTVAYLGVDNSCHFQSRYALLHKTFAKVSGSADKSIKSNNLKQLENSMEFTITSTSVIRIFASPYHATHKFFVTLKLDYHPTTKSSERTSTDIQIHNEKNDPLKDSDRYSWLLATLQPGKYILYVDAHRSSTPTATNPTFSRFFDIGLAFVIDFELAIKPVYSVSMFVPKSEIKNKDEYDPNLKLNVANEVKHYTNNKLRICKPFNRAKTRPIVHLIDIKVTKRTVIFMEMSYNFLENHLAAILEGIEESQIRRRWTSTIHKNQAQIYVVVEAGTYKLSIRSLGVLHHVAKDGLNTNDVLCSTKYRLAIFIHPENTKIPKELTLSHPSTMKKRSNNDQPVKAVKINDDDNDVILDNKNKVCDENDEDSAIIPKTTVIAPEKISGKGVTSDSTGHMTLQELIVLYNSKTHDIVRMHGESIYFGQPLSVNWHWLKVVAIEDSQIHIAARSDIPETNVRFLLLQNENSTIQPSLSLNQHDGRYASSVYHIRASQPTTYLIGIGTLTSKVKENTMCPVFGLDLAVVTLSNIRQNNVEKNCKTVLPSTKLELSDAGYAKEKINASFPSTKPLVHSMYFKVVRDSILMVELKAPFSFSHYLLRLARRGDKNISYIIAGGSEANSMNDAQFKFFNNVIKYEKADMSALRNSQNAYPSSYDANNNDYSFHLLESIGSGDYELSIEERLSVSYDTDELRDVDRCMTFNFRISITPDSVEPDAVEHEKVNDDQKVKEEEEKKEEKKETSPKPVESKKPEHEPTPILTCHNDGHLLKSGKCDCVHPYSGAECLECTDGYELTENKKCLKKKSKDEIEEEEKQKKKELEEKQKQLQEEATKKEEKRKVEEENEKKKKVEDEERFVEKIKCNRFSCGCQNIDAFDEGLNERELQMCHPIDAKCYVKNNHIRCKCPKRYAGKHCSKCAKGYEDYPRCGKVVDEREEEDENDDKHQGTIQRGTRTRPTITIKSSEKNHRQAELNRDHRRKPQHTGSVMYGVYIITLLCCIIVIGALLFNWRNQRGISTITVGRSSYRYHDDGL